MEMNKAIKSTIMLAAMTAFTLPAFADTIQTTETIRSQKAGVAVTTTRSAKAIFVKFFIIYFSENEMSHANASICL